ncbi:MAG: outer membrane protein assembly factor BamA [Verrucomicrobiota bacterium JB022]|nr:outer membrane protein assembly factor BamA [Verrucomicrobiota bacterium JB022]
MKTTRANLRNKGGLRLASTLFILSCGGFAYAQTDTAGGESQPAGEVAQAPTQIVGDIQIEFVDTARNLSEEAVFARVQIREGQIYDQSLIDRSIRLLYNTRLFDYIEAVTEQMPDNQIRVIFRVQGRYRINDIDFVGNDKISDRRLRDKVKSGIGFILDERSINEDAVAIRDYYREKGYTEVEVNYDIERDDVTGQGSVTFQIDEGRKLKIETIDFVGNDTLDDDELSDEMETSERRWWSFLTGSGRFNEKTFQEDLEKVRAYYIERGFLDVSIPESNVSLEYPKDGEISLTIRVDEGKQYRVGSIDFQGEDIYPQPLLYSIIRLRPGEVFSPKVLSEDVEALENVYGVRGYLDVDIRPERVPNIETGNIDLVFRINEGTPSDVESIIVEGNTKTKSTVIVRELALQPGRTFNLIYMKNSEARLKNTRYFEDVQLNHVATNVPGRRNLNIRVSEARTGNFQIGAGFSTLENMVLFFEVSQSNFDIFKWRSPVLQGDGQKFRFRGSIGSRSNELVLSWEEPWLFEQRLAFGFTLFRSESEYNSSYYDEMRTGIELYLRKRLFGLVDGNLAYRYEIVDLDNVSGFAPQVIRDEAAFSPRSISKVNFTMVRDTRNDLVLTTRGSRFSLHTGFAGLGGDTEYAELETRNAVFIPLFKTGDQVLSVLFRAGSLYEYSDKPTPFFDRYYLGGPDTLRGFEYREVSPRDDDGLENIGGNSYAFSSFEYTVKVAGPLRVAAFYDWGFVNQGDFEFDPGSYNDNFGFGIRLMVLGNPLRLDYGIPLTTTTEYGTNDAGQRKLLYTNDSGNVFNFSFGTRF